MTTAPKERGALPFSNLKISETTALGTTTWAYANTDVSQVTSMSLPAPSGSGTGPTTSYLYDADGRQDQVENALGQFTTTTFTADGQAASLKDNLGDTTAYAYGHGQELLSTTDANHHTTSDQYDSRYRLVETTDANGGVTQITLDPAGNRVKLVDSDGNATTWTFSPTNLPLTETNSLGTTTTTYNLDQEATSIQDADGRLRDFVYNGDQQLTAENWMSGNTIIATMAYGYDLAGDLTSASDPNSAYAFAYNGDGEVTSVDNAGTPNVPDVVLSSTYDAVGDRTSLSATIAGTADFSNTYAYNGDQQLTTVQQQGVNGGNIVSPKEIDYGYNALGQFTSMVDYNYIGEGPRSDVLTGAFSYDNGARLTGIAYTSNGGTDTIDTLGWGYDPANNVTSFSSIDGTAAYGYDPTNQLTSASYTTASGGHQPANESFSFDLNGNRDSSGYTTGSDNLMTSDGTYTYQHDADGNLISRTQIANTYSTQYQTTYTWDYRNRLTDVGYYDNNDVLTKHVHFVYDVFDHLIATEVDPTGGGTYTEIQHYVLDVSPEIPLAGVPGTALAQPDLAFDGNQNLIQRNLVALSPAGVDAVMVQGTVSSLTQGDSDIFVALDNLGTPRDDTNGSGTLVNHKVFSVYGQDVYNSNPSIVNWGGFAGGHADPTTGLVNDYHRWLNTADGKWLADDPTGFGANDADLSRYALNSPTNGTDNTGLGFWSNYGYYGQNIWSGMAAGAANGALNGAAYGGVIGGISTGGPGMGPGMAVGALLGGLFGAVTGGLGAMNANSPSQAAQIGYYYGGLYGPVGGLAGGLSGPAMVADAYAAYLAGVRASQAAELRNEIAGYIASRAWWQQQLLFADAMELKGTTLIGFHQGALRRIAAINVAIAAAEKKLSNL